jgi:hypothetical protein
MSSLAQWEKPAIVGGVLTVPLYDRRKDEYGQHDSFSTSS